MPNCTYFSTWFPRKYRIYAACKNFVQMRPTAMQYSYDPVICWWKDGDRWAAGTASRDFYVANTSPSSHVGLNNVEGHPCPRPLDQMRQLVEQWVMPGGIVLDPFAGSCTTGVACIQTGRKFIGIEKDEKYFEIAAMRMEQASIRDEEYVQRMMFANIAP
jgi:DNA modification methylase